MNELDMTEICTTEDPTQCTHEHKTLMGTDPVLGLLAEAIEQHGIKRGGITYDEHDE